VNGPIDLEWYRLAAAYLFVLLPLAIVKWKGINRERDIAVAAFRMTVQLILVGYLLQYVFVNAHPLYTIVLVGIMVAFSIRTVLNRAKRKAGPRLRRWIALSMMTGILFSIAYFILVIIGLEPWYEPRYVIPIAGMIVGNSMTGIALGVNTLMEGMESRRAHIEAALMLGATPKQACRDIANQAFDDAMLPTIHSMLGMGIVFLPGMMTGQILGGASPLVAIEYQIAVMLSMLGSVALSALMFAQFGYRFYFNSRQQLESGESPVQ
jgi:TIGR00245 family protein